MAGRISIEKLNPHPKNEHYFSDISGDRYEEIKRSIATYGVRDPLKVTTNFTVISGNQRLRIAKDIGLTNVPIEVIDPNENDDVKNGIVDAEEYVEYLLIADNRERRGEPESDPIKIARQMEFMARHWKIREGSAGKRSVIEGENCTPKKIVDLADEFDMSERTAKSLMRLNALIPEIQSLVSAGELGTTAASTLAGLTEDEQRALLTVRGAESIASTTVEQAKEISQVAKESRDTGVEFSEVVARLERELAKEKREKESLASRIEELETQEPQVIETVKETVPPDIERRLREIERERDELEASLVQSYDRIRQLERLERSVKHQQESPLYDIYRSITGANGHLKVFLESDRFAGDVIVNADRQLLDRLLSELRLAERLTNELIGGIEHESGITVIDVTEPNKLIEVV
ncbi:ParB/RepB/Spo0J family partition protein [Brevibacillus brevis]|uniref:ParB/RepB/Spo0J family partition protein n=1 Tax=Brevibacillus brevis TaxID=1393 RepID=UPI00165DDACE|nr:ParB/RepB/Spo0J family partition protein [Brevibacillus brevis]